MRLKKAEKKKYKQQIKDSMIQKIVSLAAAREIKWAWSELTHDHWQKLRLDLDHIGKRPLIDALEADCIDGETMFNTRCYFKHYDDAQLSLIFREILDAKQGIAYLERLAKEEIEQRKSQK